MSPPSRPSVERLTSICTQTHEIAILPHTTNPPPDDLSAESRHAPHARLGSVRVVPRGVARVVAISLSKTRRQRKEPPPLARKSPEKANRSFLPMPTPNVEAGQTVQSKLEMKKTSERRGGRVLTTNRRISAINFRTDSPVVPEAKAAVTLPLRKSRIRRSTKLHRRQTNW